MKLRCLLVVALIGCAFVCVLGSTKKTQQKPERCIAEQALLDRGHITSATTRSDVEAHFELDGGLQFREKAVYVYRKCPYLKIDVEFKADPAVEKALAPNDTVISVSRMYVDFPARD
jgi:hypothetical protein